MSAVIALLVFVLGGCQSANVREDDPDQGTGEGMVDNGEFVDSIPGEGRWVAALEASDDPRTVFITDRETDWVYEIGGDSPVTLERLEWLDEDELEIHGGDDSLILQILPPEPDTADNSPRFVVFPPEFRSRYAASGFQSFGPASAGGGSNGSLTLKSIYYTKQRLKRDSNISRGPRVSKDP